MTETASLSKFLLKRSNSKELDGSSHSYFGNTMNKAKAKMRRAVSFDRDQPPHRSSEAAMSNEEWSQQPRIKGILKKPETTEETHEPAQVTRGSRIALRLLGSIHHHHQNNSSNKTLLTSRRSMGNLRRRRGDDSSSSSPVAPLKKAVSFESQLVASVASVEPVDTKNAVWYSKDEIKELKSTNAEIIVSKLKGQFEENDSNTFMGLEPFLRKATIQRQRQSIMDAVLHEQARQICNYEPVNAERVARAYRRQRRSFQKPSPSAAAHSKRESPVRTTPPQTALVA